MNNFWNNVIRFFQFFASALLGFFLTTLNPLFELLREPKYSPIALVGLCILLALLVSTLKLMLAVN